MMKKITNIVLVIVFISILAVPLLLTETDSEAISTIDNRKLAANPVSAFLQGARFTDAVENYLNDRIGFREELIDFHGRILYSLFKSSPVEKVILGKEGWLFYDGEKTGDGKPISQYMGNYKFSEEELQAIKDNLIRTRDYCAQRNIEFVLYIAPNKERVYSEFMPDVYQKNRKQETCGTEQLVDYLRENTDINVVWPYEDLKAYMQKHPDELIYYKLDTHWNELGGYIGAKALLDAVGCQYPIPDVEDVAHTRKTSTNSGDLRNMMAVGNWLSMNETEWEIHGILTEDTIMDEGSFDGQWIYHSKGKDTRNLLMVRDSFTSAMKLVLGTSFNEVNLCHAASYSPELIEKTNPDIFVYELVERCLDTLFEINLIPEV